MLQRYYPSGLLGLGLTALLASFMSGMAGNVTAFNTVWTYDIYQAYIRPNETEQHYVWMGHVATVAGAALSVGTTYLAMNFSNMGDYLLLVFSLFMFPMSTAFLLGMFWKRTSATGAFAGMLTGVGVSCLHYALYRFGVLHYRTDMAANLYTIIVGWSAGFTVSVVLSLLTKPRPESELQGLVYSVGKKGWDENLPWHSRPAVWGAGLLGMLATLAIIFW
jgi:SSS family solute:Na+ symporter